MKAATWIQVLALVAWATFISGYVIGTRVGRGHGFPVAPLVAWVAFAIVWTAALFYDLGSSSRHD